MAWGNVEIVQKKTNAAGKIVLYGDLNLKDKNFKKTKKVHWITKDEDTIFEITLVELDHLITKKKIEWNNEKI